jgi:hypothetical protein
VGVGSLWPTKKEEAIFIVKVDLQTFEDNNTKVNAAATLI